MGEKKNFGLDLLHPDHSHNCTAVVVLHLPVLPPFLGHVSLMDAVETFGAQVKALQACHGDLFRRVYALLGIIRWTFVRVPLVIVRQNVLSLRWQPMMLSQLRCGTKIDHLKPLNMIRYLQQTTRHDLPLCVDMKPVSIWAELYTMELPFALGESTPHLWSLEQGAEPYLASAWV